MQSGMVQSQTSVAAQPRAENCRAVGAVWNCQQRSPGNKAEGRCRMTHMGNSTTFDRPKCVPQTYSVLRLRSTNVQIAGRLRENDKLVANESKETRRICATSDGFDRRGKRSGRRGKDARLLAPETETDGEEAEVCFICANPVIHQSIAPCNHVTCHICALRMRALYRNKDCPHCRTAAPYVIFTDDVTKRYEEYGAGDITTTDETSGIRYSNEDIVGDTVLLLRYNCPDEACDYAGFGWPDLHRHVREVHHKKMCDLCTRNKKVFTHEHELFTDKGLDRHMRNGDDRPGAVDQTGFKGHPLCGFCGERFYDDDKLYEHCRNKHERCFICDRRDARQPHYYRNYDALEEHFRRDHYLCIDRECMDKKFVVFESEMDLKAHQLEEHGNTLSKDVRRDVQVVSLSDFDYRPAYQNNGGRGGERGGGGRNHDGRSGRGRDPNAELPLAVGPPQSMRRDEIAYQRQRQLEVQSAQTVTTRTFGSRLTPSGGGGGGGGGGSGGGSSSSRPSRPKASTPDPLADPLQGLSPAEVASLTPQERARRVRHGAVLERAANLLANDAGKVQSFRAELAAFRSGAATAAQLVDGLAGLLADTTSPTALGSLVREVADLYEEPGRADALRQAWQNRRAVTAATGASSSSVQPVDDYPSLPGLGGMHGATTSTSGWAGAAAVSPSIRIPASSGGGQHSTRVLRLKHSTRPGAAAVAAAAATAPSTGPAGRIVPGATWTVPSSGRQASAGTTSNSSSRPSASPAPASSAAFPALPSTKKANSTPTLSWLGASGSSSTAAPAASSSTAARIGGSSSSSSSSRPHQRPPGEDAFPALPAAPKPLTTIFGYGRGAVRRDVGGRDTGFSWGDGETAGGAGGGDVAAEADDDVGGGSGNGKGKKKGRQGKKVLVSWG
ncbi:c2h2 finger domain containing protein [Grosmannia clavigera kw1407]|uniref:RING-type E3 ubiquitin transferase n=1 Tax=Grosmannia clavigera (strain kw1407 / UAMH 11150) TaxID=655863 RepID=F0XQQ3_GROCL|nr:c2h2 finger domain containing protein [Grosmannia clavigera kw1407]EFW99997.1 c2h2 finger domain containing protein [Grosmannia clavigera kw1407]